MTPAELRVVVRRLRSTSVALERAEAERDEALEQRDRARSLACDLESKLARARDGIKAVEPRYYWDDGKLAALAAFDEAVAATARRHG